MTTEIEPVRSQSPELAAMTLPKLKTVATQLGVDGAAKMKKDALVEEGSRVEVGQKMVVGAIDPKQVLRILGPRATQVHLVNEIESIIRRTLEKAQQLI